VKIYIAGPMRGQPDHGKAAFALASGYLRASGHEVFNPSELVQDFTTDSGRHAMATESQWLALNADAVVMLPGWELSLGSQAEWALARALGIPIYYDMQEVPDVTFPLFH
jgi:hypothetical protein